MTKAVILIGGLGTRLRPFTLDAPKPLLPVLNQPFILYQLNLLKSQGIREVILATAYRRRAFQRVLGDGRKLGLRIRYNHETIPLGTGGAIRNALPFLDGTTLILNGDVLQDLDIPAFLKRHRANRAEVSVTLVPVKDPRRFGVVETGRCGRVKRFLEKPAPDETAADTINAGAYLFETSAVESIPAGVPYSVERGLYPKMLREGRRLYAFNKRGYWLDFGTIGKYLQVHRDIMEGTAPFLPAGLKARGRFRLAPGARTAAGTRHTGKGLVVLGRFARIGREVRFNGSTCVGERCRIEAGAELEDCVIFSGVRIGPEARLSGCIIGTGCRIGANAEIGPGRALGPKSVVREFSKL